MAPAKKQTLSDSTVTALEVGAAALAMAAAAGATYYFYGDKSAKKHRQAATKWAKSLKQDVIDEAKKLKQLDKQAMTAIVNKATEAYKDLRNVDTKDLKTAAAELKKHWKMIEQEARGVAPVAASKKVAPKKVVSKKAAPKKAVKKN